MRRIDWREIAAEDIAKFPPVKRPRGNNGGKTKREYIDVLAAFDTETTTIKIEERKHAFVYVWMLYVDALDCVITGRTMPEFVEFASRIADALDGRSLVLWVHNLSFEFQFLKGWYHFDADEVFALDKRKILRASMFDGAIELRCSYIQSNMSLDEFTRKMGVENKKLDDFNYSKTRYPWTCLTDHEWEYCCNDVIGLVQAMRVNMQADGDTLYTVPMTSTGYVRRDAKRAMKGLSYTLVQRIVPDMRTYQMLREAFRGGNTHANRYYAGLILEDVKSADRSSSYPDVQVNCKYPMSRFQPEKLPMDEARLVQLIYTRQKAVLMRIRLYNVRLRDSSWGMPYLSYDKCRNVCGEQKDNGRILCARALETTITDVDFKIILSEYEWEALEVLDAMSARYGRLPLPLIDQTIEYYRRKTELKGVEGDEIFYMKSKNKLNSIYGMSAQDPVKDRLLYIDAEQMLRPEGQPIADLLDRSNRKAFLAYQWGVWVTAWARYRLEEGIRLAGNRCVYVDTDSVKYIGDIDWTEYNAARKADSEKNGAFAYDKNGMCYHMGVFEADGEYTRFCTLGAKKYAYELPGSTKTHITVAGVRKKTKGTKMGGGDELDEAARKQGCSGLDLFKPGYMVKRNGQTYYHEGFVFCKAGGAELIYNDLTDILRYEAPGGVVKIASNVVIQDGTYTLNVTGEYARLIFDDTLIYS